MLSNTGNSYRLLLTSAILLATVSIARAESPDWGRWQNPAAPAGHEDDPQYQTPGTGIYLGSPDCATDESKLLNRHAHWVCRYDRSCPGEYCWWGVSDAFFTCPDGKYKHVSEWVRYTKVPCGKKDWAQTQYYAGLLGETWATQSGPANDPGSRATPPSDSDELPTPMPGQQISWGSGLPPETEQTAKEDPKNPANEKKTATGENGGSNTPPKVEEHSKTVKTTTGRNEKRPRKSVTVRTRKKVSVARRTSSASANEHATGPAVSIGIGFGGPGHRGLGRGDDRDSNRHTERP